MNQLLVFLGAVLVLVLFMSFQKNKVEKFTVLPDCLKQDGFMFKPDDSMCKGSPNGPVCKLGYCTKA